MVQSKRVVQQNKKALTRRAQKGDGELNSYYDCSAA